MSSADQVREAIDRIRRWCEANGDARLVFECMNPPATDAEIDAAEEKLGLKLPEDVRALYRICNGQDENAEANEEAGLEVGLFPWAEQDLSHLLYPLSEVVSSTPKKRGGGMPGFMVGWVPIASNYGGDEVVIDLSDDSPHRGRVLHFNHEIGSAIEMALSLADLLTDLADKLESGEASFDEEEGLIYSDPPGFEDESKFIYDPVD